MSATMETLRMRKLRAEAEIAEFRLQELRGGADVTADAEVLALRNRAHTGLACAAFVAGWKREEQHVFWQGYAKALRDLTRGMGAKLAQRDQASGAYQAPTVLQAAIAVLGDDIEHLTRAEILERVAAAGVKRPFHDVPGLDATTGHFVDGAVASLDPNHEEVTNHVKNDSPAHGTSVGQQGGAS